MRVVVAIVAATIAAVLIGGTYLPIKKDPRPKICLECGVLRQDHIVIGILRSTISGTEFSAWYQRRIGLKHAHRWQEDSAKGMFGENLWGTQWELSPEGPLPGIQLDYSMLATVMRGLERLDMDRDLWKELTTPDPNRARQVVDASWNLFDHTEFSRLFEGEVGKRIRDWWKFTQLYLQKPEAAKDGFQEFAGSLGWDRMSSLRLHESSNP